MTRFQFPISGLALFIAILFVPVFVSAQEHFPQPRLYSLFPAGARAGSSVAVKLTRTEELDAPDKLIFSHPGITAVPLMAPADRFHPQPYRVDKTFTVTVAADVPPGYYEVRAVGYHGISSARTFAVSNLPEANESEPNNDPAKGNDLAVGSVMNGATEPQKYDYFRITLKKSQRITIDGVAQRIDSKTDLAFEMLDEKGDTLAESRDAIGRDPVLDFTAPADGVYILRVHDFTFEGGEEFFYRVSVTSGPWIDYIDPPVIAPGGGTFTIYGRNLPGSAAAPPLTDGGSPLEKLIVQIPAPPAESLRAAMRTGSLLRPFMAPTDFTTYQFKSDAGLSNPVPLLISAAPITTENEPNNTPETAQQLTIPCEVVGRFNPKADLDWYTFAGKKDQPLWIEIDSQRLGLPTDPAFLIQQLTTDADGKVTAKDLQEFDESLPLLKEKKYDLDSSDPGLRFNPPADGNYRLLVRDLYGSTQGDARFFYRLKIRPAQPDFRLVTLPVKLESNNKQEPWNTIIRRGGSERMRIAVFRREGFQGEITVTAENLPPGVTAAPVIVAKQSSTASLVLTAAPDAPAFAGPITVTGRARIGDAEVAHTAIAAQYITEVQQDNISVPARLTQTISIAVDDHASAPATVQLGTQPVYRIARGGKLEIPIKLNPVGDFKGDATMKPADLPENQVRGNEARVTASEPAAKMLLEIDPNASPGSFTMMAFGETRMPFRPAAPIAEAADAEYKRLEQAVNEANGTASKAQQQRQQAEQALNQSRQGREQSQNARNTAQQKSDAAVAEMKSLHEGATAIKQQADEASKHAAEATAAIASAADAAARSAAENTSKALQDQANQAKQKADEAAKKETDADARAAQAADAVKKADEVVQAASEKLTAAEAAQKAAIETEKAAQQDKQLGEHLKNEVAETTRRIKERSNQRDVRLDLNTNTITIEIVRDPVTLSVNPPSPAVTIGQRAEVTVTAQRESGADEEIVLELVKPPNGVSLPDRTVIAKGSNETKLIVATDPKSPLGPQKLTLRARTRYNNRDVNVEQAFDLAINAVPPPPPPPVAPPAPAPAAPPAATPAVSSPAPPVTPEVPKK